ncbi:Uncharacterised protein [Mycobacterium tuberculosis]|uniref:Uncharacterized protein n=1 Tax=Mycobacterium tuberculosis TaxID=1773 RepID=A0A655FW85_MYCTX|nr:Uncharacterised protein [Mycobacterium tuberculosis]CKR92547.1 Uncharacterised protein [Mycobacterium tuberculosis]CKS84733.1 Uncharacterised protein [Mycobacterium tuberculosis]CKT25924.1 Uncharacterised protein [Mycobacterium tuberculosis]CNL19892.1 Uncharacterised protein [Mycobacterium tuberculosis]
MGEEDHLPPHQPIDVHAQRCRQLFDQTFVGDENLCAVQDGGVDQVPDDQPERDVGQVLRQLEPKQLGIQAAHRDGGRSGGDGDPERPQHRAAVPLLDVLPAQVQPQLVAAEPVDQIASDAGQCPRLCLEASLSIHECHADPPGLPNFSRRPRRRNRIHSHRPLGSRRVTRKNQPNRSHSWANSLRRPGCDNT